MAELDRESLESRRVKLLNRGGWANPDVFLVRTVDDELVVVKDFGPRSALVRRLLGRWITSRELRAYAALADSPGVPRLHGTIDSLAFVLEYRPGVLLSRSLAGHLPEEFMSELEQAIRAMHARGVVHLDLRHRSNLLAGEDGHPVLIDFASALCFRPGSLMARTLLPLLARIDLGARRKWEERLGPAGGPGS
jgi:serine/threonine protein kinase